MLLIWGWRTRMKTLGEGTFHCPNCGADRAHRHREARRWFTLFFIPVIPLKVLGTFVECTQCQSTFDDRVLTMPTNEQMLEHLATALRAVVVAVLDVGGAPDATERETAIRAIGERMGESYDDAALDADIAMFRQTTPDAYLAPLADSLTDQGKERLLQAAVDVALAGGVDDGKLDVARHAGSSLLMTNAHIEGVIAVARQQAQ